MFIRIYQTCIILWEKSLNSIQWRIGRFKMTAYGILFGKNLIIQGNIYIKIGIESVVKIGDNCFFKSGRGINPLSRNIKSEICVEDGASLIIGNNCGFSSVCLWAHELIKIGDNVNIGADTILMDSDAHSLSYKDRRDVKIDLRNKKNIPIIIEDDVLIGARCIILKGVRIGARSVIGSGSIVVRNIPSDCIAAGNPAKIIKKIN
jgi:acetyltransferase-like isoleucine patch superfamily enzyme